MLRVGSISIVARRIQEIRVSKKWSRQKLGDELTPPKTYLQIYRIETGETHVTDEEIINFAEVLEVSVASLFRESKAAS